MKKLLYLLTVLAALFAACNNDSDDSLKLNTTSLTMKVGEDFTIYSKKQTDITFESNDPFVATVNAGGKVTAEHIGSTTIRVSSPKYNSTVYVTVWASSNLLEEPVTEWGMSQNVFVARNGLPDDSSEATLVYQNVSDAAPTYIYYFNTETGGLAASEVRVKAEHSSELAQFLSERYELVEYNPGNNSLQYIDKDEAYAVLAGIYNTNYWQVRYEPVTVSE